MNAMHIDGLDLTQIRLLAELSRSRSVSQAAQRIASGAADRRIPIGGKSCAGQAAQAIG
jgi:hypothetical protein